MTEIKVDQIADHLKKLKETQGEDAYFQAVGALARKVLESDNGMAFVENLADKLGETGLDLEQLQAEAQQAKASRAATPETDSETVDTNEVFIKALQEQMPNLKTQAHFDLTQSAFQALQICLNAYFGGDHVSAKQSRDGLNKLLDLAAQVKDIDDKLKEEPAATSNKNFKQAPKEYSERDKVDAFLSDLDEIESSNRLNQWYSANREGIDEIVSQDLRNKLFDKIRQKKKDLAN